MKHKTKYRTMQLSYAEIERLAEAWSRDADIAKKIRTFLEMFGPSGNDLVVDFFNWAKKEHGATVKCSVIVDDTNSTHMEYEARFKREEDELAFTLRFR